MPLGTRGYFNEQIDPRVMELLAAQLQRGQVINASPMPVIPADHSEAPAQLVPGTIPGQMALPSPQVSQAPVPLPVQPMSQPPVAPVQPPPAEVQGYNRPGWVKAIAIANALQGRPQMLMEWQNENEKEAVATQATSLLGPIQKRIESNDLEGATQQLDALLMTPPKGLHPSVLDHAFKTRASVGTQLQKRRGLATAVQQLDGDQDPAKVILGLSPYMDPEVIKAMAPLLSHKDRFTTSVSAETGFLFITNNANGKVSAVPIPGYAAKSGIKPTSEQEGRATSVTGGKYGYLELLQAAKGSGPEGDQARVWLSQVLKPVGGQVGELDAAVFQASKGRFKTAEEASAGGPEGVLAMQAARSLVEDSKLRVSREQGVQAATTRENFEMKTPIAFLEGMKASRVIDTSTGHEVNATQVTRGDVQGASARYKIINNADQVKTLDNLNVIENLSSFYRETAPMLAQPGAETVVQRGVAWIETTFGYPGTGSIIKAFAPTRLALGKIFQGAGAQLSDRDVEAASGLEMKTGDSQQTLLLKAAALDAFANLTRASLAGNKDLAKKALSIWNKERDELLKSGLGGGNLYKDLIRTKSGAIIPAGVK